MTSHGKRKRKGKKNCSHIFDLTSCRIGKGRERRKKTEYSLSLFVSFRSRLRSVRKKNNEKQKKKKKFNQLLL